jgi:8-oxo-dGTP diphosphatase
VGAVIKDGAGRLLLIRRGHEPGAGLWSIPGGRIEAGESDARALVREVREETGLVVVVGRLLGRVERPGLAGAVLDIRDYAAVPAGGELVAGDDAADACWADPDLIAELASRGELTSGLIEALVSWGLLPSRRAGRVIVLDPADRVLLLRYDNDPPDGRHWATPGGGLNPGESYAAAASRELTEETGWDDVALLGEIHRQVRTLRHEGRIIRQQECLFLARIDAPCRELGDVAAMHAADGIVASRWWTLAELDTTAEVVWPAGLAALIRGALG